MMPKVMSTAQLETAYDALAEALDEVRPEQRPLYLAKLTLALANFLDDVEKVAQAIAAAKRDL